jgi:hypothetical protein
MSVAYSPTAEAELEDLRSFLLSAFEAGPEAPLMKVDLLRWKYFDPHTNGNSPRSYILKQQNAAVAHCGAAPVRFLMPQKEVRGVCFMDWAGNRRLPGIGVVLMRRIMQENAVAVVAGGNEGTRSVIPRLGFVPDGTLEHYVRVVRPRKLFQTHGSEAVWKRTARFVRNLVWNQSSLRSVPDDWTAAPISQFVPGHWYYVAASTFTLTRRDPEILNHWLRCPRGASSGSLIRRAGQACGHFLLNRLGSRTRIIDLRVDSEQPNDWENAYTLATRQAMEDPDTGEILAVASMPLARQALLANGFRLRESVPLFLYDPGHVMASHPPIHWNPIDDDTALV